jgi:hypothetical protein
MFKVGDEIICINDDNFSYIKKGHICFIESITHYNTLRLKYYYSSHYSKDKFILLKKYLEKDKYV